MAYEPHTERLAPDEQFDLPWDATGVNVERDGEEYVVHYLTRARPEGKSFERQVRERLQEFDFDGPAERRRKAREIRQSMRSEESGAD